MGIERESGGRRSRTTVIWILLALLPVLYFLFVPVVAWYLVRWHDSGWLAALLWPAIKLDEHSAIYQSYVAWLLQVFQLE